MRLSGSTISSQSLVRNIAKEHAWLSNRSHKSTKPWICQQCYSQRALQAKRVPYTSKSQTRVRQLNRKIDEYSSRPFSQSRVLAQAPKNEPTKERSNLPSEEEGRRSHLAKRLSHVMDHLQSNIFIAGQRLNDLTGYSGIEALKKDIEQQGIPTPQ